MGAAINVAKHVLRAVSDMARGRRLSAAVDSRLVWNRRMTPITKERVAPLVAAAKRLFPSLRRAQISIQAPTETRVAVALGGAQLTTMSHFRQVYGLGGLVRQARKLVARAFGSKRTSPGGGDRGELMKNRRAVKITMSAYAAEPTLARALAIASVGMSRAPAERTARWMVGLRLPALVSVYASEPIQEWGSKRERPWLRRAGMTAGALLAASGMVPVWKAEQLIAARAADIIKAGTHPASHDLFLKRLRALRGAILIPTAGVVLKQAIDVPSYWRSPKPKTKTKTFSIQAVIP